MLLLVSLWRFKDFAGITVSVVSLVVLLLPCALFPSLYVSLSASLLQCLAAAVLCSGQSSALSLELSDWELCPLAAPLSWGSRGRPRPVQSQSSSRHILNNKERVQRMNSSLYLFFPSTFSWKHTVTQRCRWPQHWWLVIWSALDMSGCLHPRIWIQDSVQRSNSELESAQLCFLLWPLLEWHT